jgi:hypothetical protein
MKQTTLDLAHATPDTNVGFNLGWDHARHGVAPPAALLKANSPIRAGFGAARLRFARRALRPSGHVRQWLALRTQAWLSGQAFEPEQLTANLIKQLQTSHCPITRQPLAVGAPVVRINPQAAYAAGNVAILSEGAARAKLGMPWQAIWQQAEQAQPVHGKELDAAAWRRLAVLVSFTTPLSHAEAAKVPLLVMPTNRLRVLNSVQCVQVLLTRLLAQPGWTPYLRRWANCLGDSPARHELHRLAAALLPRLLPCKLNPGEPAGRHAMEDAWLCERVNRRWQQFALTLSEAQMVALLDDAQIAGWAGRVISLPTREQATEGWALDSMGQANQLPRVPAACPVMKSLRPVRSTPLTNQMGRRAKSTGTPDLPPTGFKFRSNTELAGI